MSELKNLYENVIKFFYKDDIEIVYNKVFTIRKKNKQYPHHKEIENQDIHSISLSNDIYIEYYQTKIQGTLVIESMNHSLSCVQDDDNIYDILEIYRQFFMCYRRLLGLNKTNKLN